MELEKVISVLPEIISNLKVDYVIKNDVIRDDIFSILEKHCTVIYYPIKDEDNCGFHIKRMVNGTKQDFVYINTAKPLPKQVFTAAHELGHVWCVVAKAEGLLKETIPPNMEEDIINRFAAELLMPEAGFVRAFWAHLSTVSKEKKAIRLDEMVRVMVMQMNDFLVPYEAVRRRMIEVKILNERTAESLRKNQTVIDNLIAAFSNDLNTTLDTSTNKMTIPGLRDLIEEKSKTQNVSYYTLKRISEDFNVVDVNPSEDMINLISGGRDDV